MSLNCPPFMEKPPDIAVVLELKAPLQLWIDYRNKTYGADPVGLSADFLLSKAFLAGMVAMMDAVDTVMMTPDLSIREKNHCLNAYMHLLNLQFDDPKPTTSTNPQAN
jgi:hypothetical protein